MRYVMMAVSLVAVAVVVAGCGGAGTPGDVLAPVTTEVGDKYSAAGWDFAFRGARTGTRLVGDFPNQVDVMTADGVWHHMDVGNALRRHGDRLSCRYHGGGNTLVFVADMARDTCQAVYRGPGGVRGVLLDRPGVE